MDSGHPVKFKFLHVLHIYGIISGVTMGLHAVPPVGPVALVNSVNTREAFLLVIMRTFLSKCKSQKANY